MSTYNHLWKLSGATFQKYPKYNLKDAFSQDKNDVKEKAYDLVRLREAMQEKLKTASYSEQIQTLTLVSDKWSRMYCPEYFNVFNVLIILMSLNFR